MRKTLFFILFFVMTLSYGQTKKRSAKSIKILDCETGLIYYYSDNKVLLKGTWFAPTDTSKIWYSKTLDKTASTSFDKLFDTFSKLDKKVFYYNHCVRDGFNFKIYIQNDTTVQKIFVGNYYDPLIDSLTTLFQEQFEDFKSDFIVRISYGNKQETDRLIKLQTACKENVPADYKNHLLDNWCELEEKK